MIYKNRIPPTDPNQEDIYIEVEPNCITLQQKDTEELRYDFIQITSKQDALRLIELIRLLTSEAWPTQSNSLLTMPAYVNRCKTCGTINCAKCKPN